MLRQSNAWRAEEHNGDAEMLRLVRDATSARADWITQFTAGAHLRMNAFMDRFIPCPGCGLMLDRESPKAMQWSGKIDGGETKIWCCAPCRPFIKAKLARVVKTSDQARQETKDRSPGLDREPVAP